MKTSEEKWTINVLFGRKILGDYVRDKQFHVKSLYSCGEDFTDITTFVGNVQENLCMLFKIKIGIN